MTQNALSLKNYSSFSCTHTFSWTFVFIKISPFIRSFVHSFLSHSVSLPFILRDDMTPFFVVFLRCLCVVNRALQVKGRIVTYFMGLRRRPLTVFGIFLSIVISLILLTICISTILYCNAVKKSRINPESNYIKVVRRIKNWEPTHVDNGHFFFSLEHIKKKLKQ